MNSNSTQKFQTFLQDNPLTLREIMSPYAFNQQSDRVILVCNPDIPTISNCRFFQAVGRANEVTKPRLINIAKQAGLAVIPSFNIDLDKMVNKGLEIKYNTDLLTIFIKVL